jgi:TRAP transporter TAXI family solute receptor
MIKIVLYAFFALCIIPQVNAVEMGIVTGSPEGTYYQICNDISSLASNHGINLKVFPSNGSLENVAAVYKRPGVQLGIVQSDVLAYIGSLANKDNYLKRVAKKIKMVYPLYNEEVHLVARNNIKNFFDLTGKVVAVGKERSGSYLTANLLFQLSEITPAKKVEIGGSEALDALLRGDIDAMFYVAGYPVKLFQNMDPEGLLHLVPIQDKSITEFYSVSMIPSSTYSWQKEAVSTIAVKAVLMSFDYKWNHCKNVGRLANIIYDNFDWLKQHGHKKWKNVDFDFKLKKWEQYGCVKSYSEPPEDHSCPLICQISKQMKSP